MKSKNHILFRQAGDYGFKRFKGDGYGNALETTGEIETPFQISTNNNYYVYNYTEKYTD